MYPNDEQSCLPNIYKEANWGEMGLQVAGILMFA